MKRALLLLAGFLGLFVGTLLTVPGASSQVLNALTAASLEARIWTLKNKDPIRSGLDASMGTPTAVTPTTSATLGAGCSNVRTYNWCIAWVNAGGVSPLTCSANWTPSPNTKRATFTIPTPPSNAVGTLIFMQVDNATGQFLISSSGSGSTTTQEGGLRPIGTTTVDENCSNAGSKYSYLLTGSANSGQAVIPINPTQGVEVGRQYQLTTASGSLSETVTIASVQANASATAVTNLTNSYSTNDKLNIKPAGFVANASINSVGQSVIGFSGRFGGVINSIIENKTRIDASGATLKYGTDNGATFGSVSSPVRVVTICASGCTYTSVNTAFSTETSTAANPIRYEVGPGTYTEQVSFSGEDHFSLIGAGPGVTTIIKTGLSANSGVLQPGNSTNYVVSGMTLQGHRGVHLDGGGGKIIFRNIEFVTENVGGGSEDDVFLDNMVAGSDVTIEAFDGSTNEDGITLDDGGANVNLVIRNGRLGCFGNNIGGRIIRMNSAPCNLVLQNVLIDCTMTRAGGLAMTGIYYPASATGACGSNGRLIVQGSTILMNNLSTTAGSSVETFGLESGASTLTKILSIGTLGISTATSANVSVFGLRTGDAAQQATVVGGYYSATGGTSNQEFKSGAVGSIITVTGAEYANDDGTQRVVTRYSTTRDLAGGTCTGTDTVLDTGGSTTELCACRAGAYKCVSLSGSLTD